MLAPDPPERRNQKAGGEVSKKCRTRVIVWASKNEIASSSANITPPIGARNAPMSHMYIRVKQKQQQHARTDASSMRRRDDLAYGNVASKLAKV